MKKNENKVQVFIMVIIVLVFMCVKMLRDHSLDKEILAILEKFLFIVVGFFVGNRK